MVDRRHIRLPTLFLAVVLAGFAPPAIVKAQSVVEVVHPWSEGGEARAMRELRRQIEAQAVRWLAPPVPEEGEDPLAALRSRIEAGDPPTALHLKPPEIAEWAVEGGLADLGPVARQETWDQILPPELQPLLKHEGRYVAVPLNIRRMDRLWANRSVLSKIGVGLPTSWAEFNAVADKLKEGGVTPLALGGEPWQTASLFELVTLGFGGRELYRKALMELDADSLRNPILQGVFEQMRRLSAHVDPGFADRDAGGAAAMLASGDAAFLIGGDWAKRELLSTGKQPGTDLVCARVPGSTFVFDSDLLVLFNAADETDRHGRNLLAGLILSEGFQEVFSLLSGSIPARLGVPRDRFDGCARQSMDDLTAAIKGNALLPSMAHGTAVTPPLRDAITSVIVAHFGSDMSSSDAVDRLVAAIEEAPR